MSKEKRTANEENQTTLKVVDASLPVLDKKGNPLELDDSEELYTFWEAFIDLLSGTYPGDDKLEGKEKKKRYKLYLKVLNAENITELPLTAKEITTIDELAEKYAATIVFGQIQQFLGTFNED